MFIVKVIFIILIFGYIYNKFSSNVQKDRENIKREPRFNDNKTVRRPQKLDHVKFAAKPIEAESFGIHRDLVADLDLASTKPVATVKHTKQEFLATKNEQRLHSILLDILPSDYVVHSQVSLMALVKPVDFKDNSKTWAKRMDFVITDKTTKVLAVIEFDDLSHRRKKRIERDKYVDSVLEGHHPLVRIQSTRTLSEKSIIEVIEAKTQITCSRLSS